MLCLVGGGVLALALNRWPVWATRAGVLATVMGCALGLGPAVRVLLGAATASQRLPWNVPGGEFYVRLDALSAFFLVPIFLLSLLAAIYGGAYMLAYRDRKALGPPWFFFNLFIAGMALVVVARHALLFLVA